MKNGKIVFPVADRTGKISGGNRRLRTSTLIRDRPERGEEQEISRGESGGLSSPSHIKIIQHEMMRKLKIISGLSQEISFIVITWNPDMPREESCLIPLKYIDVATTTHTSLGVLLEKHIDDYWNVDES